MTLLLLLSLFKGWTDDDLYRLRREPQMIAVINGLPEDPAVYQTLADQAFADYLQWPDEPDSQSYQRFVHILTILLYHDGRSFRACLRLAQMADSHPAYSIYGVNALAALANYIRKGRQLPESRRDLVKIFRRLAKNEDLSHNARACMKMLDAAYK